MKYSVIDISSSGMSFVVAEKTDKGLDVVFSERLSLSLRHYIEGKKLCARGVEKLAETVLIVKDKCVALGVEKGWLISTAALREVENFSEISEELQKRTGIPLNAIDGKTEAYCGLISNKHHKAYKNAVLIDIGGGSIEICDLNKGEKKDMICLDFGLEDLNRKFVKKIYPSEKEAEDIKDYLKKKLKKAGVPEDGIFKTAVLSGSVSHGIYDIYCDFSDIPAIDKEKVMDKKGIKKLSKHMLGDTERSMLVLTNAPDKLYVVGSAMVVLRTLLNRFDVEKAVVSDYGVKEGFLDLVLSGKEKGKAFELPLLNVSAE